MVLEWFLKCTKYDSLRPNLKNSHSSFESQHIVLLEKWKNDIVDVAKSATWDHLWRLCNQFCSVDWRVRIKLFQKSFPRVQNILIWYLALIPNDQYWQTGSFQPPKSVMCHHFLFLHWENCHFTEKHSKPFKANVAPWEWYPGLRFGTKTGQTMIFKMSSDCFFDPWMSKFAFPFSRLNCCTCRCAFW